MSDPPPPSGPAAGWYPDPLGESWYRWWDGSTWTEAVSGPPPAPAGTGGPGPIAPARVAPARVGPAKVGPGPIGQVDQLLSETFRVGGQRSGHLLPYVLLFVMSLGLIGAFAGWYGLRDTVITIDEVTAAIDVDYGGSSAALVVYLAIFPLSMIGGVLAKAATARQAWTHQAGEAETWGESLGGVIHRWRPLLIGAVGRTALYWVLGAAFVVGSALVPPLILLFPVLIGLFVFIWLRLAFVSQAAVLAPPGSGPFSTSYRVSARQTGRLFWRLVVLALVAASLFVVVSLVGSFFTALAGVEETVSIDPDALVYDLNAYLGPNVAFFALGSAFGALGLGADYVFSAVGTTLLYRNLGGPIDPALTAAVQPAGDPGPEPVPS